MKKVVMVLIVLSISVLYAQTKEQIEKEIAKYSNNIGFIKGEKRENLKQKFPMCDEFLDVKWIKDMPKEKIGYVKYNIYYKNQKKIAWVLVSLIDKFKYPIYSYKTDIYEYKNNLKKLFKYIQKGKIKLNKLDFPYIEYKDKSIVLTGRVFKMDSIANNTQNICLVYPDTKKAWIVEGRSVGHYYSDNKIDGFYKQLEIKYNKKMFLAWMKKSLILDINFDGVNEYIDKGRVIYIYNNILHSPVTIQKYNPWSTSFTYPPKNKKCTVFQYSSTPLITDGSSYFINDCNLTDLVPKNNRKN